jgi:multidrug transporter EmrE-like cation transporter
MNLPAGAATWWLAIVAVACNAVAQLLLKRANVSDAMDLRQWLDASLLAAVALYGVSFAVTALVFARLPLSVASPVMAGGIFVLITALSWFFLNEPLHAGKVAGMALILAGIVLLSRNG